MFTLLNALAVMWFQSFLNCICKFNNQFLNTSWVSTKLLWFLDNSREVSMQFNTGWERDFEQEFAVGSTIQVPLPQEWLVTSGLGYQEQGIAQLVTSLSLDQIFGIHFGYDSYEKLVKLYRTEKQLDQAYFVPAGRQLAQQLDSLAADWARVNTPNVVGALQTDSTALDNFLLAEKKLFELACPDGEKYFCLSPSGMQTYVKTNVTQFNPQKSISDMFRTGVLGDAAGGKWVRSNSLKTHIIGTAATGGATVTGAGQSGSSLSITGTNTQTIKRGDKFSIANVNGVNPRTKQVMGIGARSFTVLQDYTLDGNPDAISIYPAIFGPGSPYQNVDSLAANGAALTFWPGTSSPSGKVGTAQLLLSKFAFLLAGATFDVPTAVEKASVKTDPETGLSVAYVKAWDQQNRKYTNRFDCCVGFGNGRPDSCACIVAGA